jgi:hypothetical protein
MTFLSFIHPFVIFIVLRVFTYNSSLSIWDAEAGGALEARSSRSDCAIQGDPPISKN